MTNLETIERDCVGHGGQNSPEHCCKGTTWIEGLKGLVLYLRLNLIEALVAYPAIRLEAIYR